MKRKTIAIGTLLGSTLATAVLVATPASASSPAAARYGVVNATVDAASDHEIGTSTAFPNYTSGAVDNYYSLAHSHIDNSPFAEGTSSPFDTGPVGQTGASQASYQQPQYADARWPGAKDGRTASFGNAGGPSAVSTAGNYKATALSSEASDAGAPTGTMKIAGPKGFDRRLRTVLAAWKARWLVPLGLKPRNVDLTVTVPTVPGVTTPTIPAVTVPTVPGVTVPNPGGGGGTTTTSTSSSPPPSKPPANGAFVSSTLAELDPHSGAIVTSGRSSLGTVNVGGGQIVLKHIDVTVKITNRGAPKGTSHVSIGSASIAGVPVTIDQDGVHVNGQGSNLPYAQADDALNGALKSAGVQLYTVQPQTKKSANELTITATGVHVAIAQVVNQAGVPSQTVDHIVGEVFADSLAAPAGPVPSLGLGGTGGLPGLAGGGTTGVPGGGSSFGSSGSGSSSGASGAAGGGSLPSAFTTLLDKPTWLLAAFLVWQALLLGTGASLWRWRAAGGVT
ncbi:MAG TPA: hypothetical protein VGH79_01545 [Gaiellaceae bacterium]